MSTSCGNSKVKPIYEWTTTDAQCRYVYSEYRDLSDRVLILKTVDKFYRGYGGFQWPRAGEPVSPDYCSPFPTCDSGGLFGWPWGIGVGEGKDLDPAECKWIVFAAWPELIVPIRNKVKVCGTAEVVYRGELREALNVISHGLDAWLRATGRYYGAQRVAVDSDSGIVSAGYDAGIATSDGGYAHNRTGHGSLAHVSRNGFAESFPEESAAGIGFTTVGGIARARGARSVAYSPGSCCHLLTDRLSSIAAATGLCACAETHGDRSIAASTGRSTKVIARGAESVAVATGANPTIDVDSGAVGIVCSSLWQWIMRPDAVVIYMYRDPLTYRLKPVTLRADDYQFTDGEIVSVCRGLPAVPKKPLPDPCRIAPLP